MSAILVILLVVLGILVAFAMYRQVLGFTRTMTSLRRLEDEQETFTSLFESYSSEVTKSLERLEAPDEEVGLADEPHSTLLAQVRDDSQEPFAGLTTDYAVLQREAPSDLGEERSWRVMLCSSHGSFNRVVFHNYGIEFDYGLDSDLPDQVFSSPLKGPAFMYRPARHQRGVGASMLVYHDPWDEVLANSSDWARELNRPFVEAAP